MKENKELKLVFGEDSGWSLSNIFTGLACLFVGCVLCMGDIYMMARDQISFFSSLWVGIVYWLTIILIILGPLGFWFVIPAFQKWGRTKPQFAWTFLVIAIAIILIALALLKII